jgi:hypothetical protein
MVLEVHYAYSNPGKYNTKQLRGALQAANLNSITRMKKYLARYVETWNHKVEFYGYSGYKGFIYAGLITDDEIFWYLEDGTDIRYYVMTPDFSPKTAPGQVNSNSGAGGVAYYDPLGVPGIEARNILPTVVELDRFKWENDVMRVIADINFFTKEEGIFG